MSTPVSSPLSHSAELPHGPEILTPTLRLTPPTGRGPALEPGSAAPAVDREHVHALQAAVDGLLEQAGAIGEASDRARAHAEILRLLQCQVVTVTAARDEALTELMESQPDSSNRNLARQLGLSRQRIDQLKRHVAAGGRKPAR